MLHSAAEYTCISSLISIREACLVFDDRAARCYRCITANHGIAWNCIRHETIKSLATLLRVELHKNYDYLGHDRGFWGARMQNWGRFDGYLAQLDSAASNLGSHYFCRFRHSLSGPSKSAPLRSANMALRCAISRASSSNTNRSADGSFIARSRMFGCHGQVIGEDCPSMLQWNGHLDQNGFLLLQSRKPMPVAGEFLRIDQKQWTAYTKNEIEVLRGLLSTVMLFSTALHSWLQASISM